MIIRPTASLAKRLKLKLSPTGEKSTTVLGDWYSNEVVLDRRQFILSVSSTSRLAVLLAAAPYSTFAKRLPEAIAEVALAVGVQNANVDSELLEMSEVILAKADNRSITGSMNDYKRHLQRLNQTDRTELDSLISISLWLSSIPCLVMKPAFPTEAALKLFGQKPQKKFIPILARSRPHLFLVK